MAIPLSTSEIALLSPKDADWVCPTSMSQEVPSHYQVLGLHDLEATGAQVKAGYRQALLIHHPDKAHKVTKSSSLATSLSSVLPGEQGKASPSTPPPRFSIDQITEAYAVLSHPARRAAYDHELRLGADSSVAKARLGNQEKDYRTGEEVVDLDDLEFDDASNLWFRNCRCGDDRGFVVEEDELEEAADEGEIGVGCRGCSLWLRVQFSVAEVEEATDENRSG